MVLGAIAAKVGVVECRLLPEMNTRPIPNVSGLAAILQKLTFTITLRLTNVKFKPNPKRNHLLHNIIFTFRFQITTTAISTSYQKLLKSRLDKKPFICVVRIDVKKLIKVLLNIK